MNTEKIIAAYEQACGKTLNPGEKEGLGYLISSLVPSTPMSLEETRRVAYMLATVEHEVGGTWRPIEEIGPVSYFTRYETGTLKDVLGNKTPGDGVRFKGRGYCQITGRSNYEKFAELLGLPLDEAPSLALARDTAAKILKLGMTQGLFTGASLAKYIYGEVADYVNARRIINGDVKTNGPVAAKYAVRWEKILLNHLHF